jgi:uncharacterized cupredoxin-like copper-binding protein
MRSRNRRALLVAIIAAGGALTAVAVAARPAAASVEIEIRYSHYLPATVNVPVGVPVTFTIRNTDPIDHEWIVGDAAVHEAHRTSAELLHEGRPTEISIPALSTRTTVVTFMSPGTLAFICHLPGHEAYGMIGFVTITP